MVRKVAIVDTGQTEHRKRREVSFCGPGEAYKPVEEGVVERGGELPCDPSGGVLSTNLIGATATIRVAEAALQVTRKAGAHQVPDAETAFCNGLGGANTLISVMILGRTP
ncbi:MAG: thiolase C-terminal domain-containing protein [Candidatus Freyarchaeota archaeon]